MYVTQRINSIIQTGNVAVSNAVLRGLGASTWTGASTNTKDRAGIVICNNSDPAGNNLVLYVKLIAKDASLTTPVSTTNADFRIPAGGSETLLIGAGIDVALIRASSSTDKATITEFF